MKLENTVIPSVFGNSEFNETHNTQYSYMAGGMANGIASVDLVVALGREGLLGIFGSGGLALADIDDAICKIQRALPSGPYGVNWLSNAHNPDAEMDLAELVLKRKVRTVEAAAFIEPSLALIYYRVKGLLKSNGTVNSMNNIIAKISRPEVAERFMSPPPQKSVDTLLRLGLISEEQADLSQYVPLASDITVEADSGGHTDNRPLVSLLPSILALRDRLKKREGVKFGHEKRIRVGAAGGISTPRALLAAFCMGADYVVTGSINQSCKEAGTSNEVKKLLSSVKMSDVVMAPSADMFEMGVKVQVLKKGTRFPMVSQKLFELYKRYDDVNDIPAKEMERLEKQAFKKSVETIWEETKNFFEKRDPRELSLALSNPKKKMALIFRWYLGKSSLWAIQPIDGSLINAQIWCGQSMGAFNEWVKGTAMEAPNNRHVSEVALRLMDEAAFLYQCMANSNRIHPY